MLSKYTMEKLEKQFCFEGLCGNVSFIALRDGIRYVPIRNKNSTAVFYPGYKPRKKEDGKKEYYPDTKENSFRLFVGKTLNKKIYEYRTVILFKYDEDLIRIVKFNLKADVVVLDVSEYNTFNYHEERIGCWDPIRGDRSVDVMVISIPNTSKSRNKRESSTKWIIDNFGCMKPNFDYGNISSFNHPKCNFSSNDTLTIIRSEAILYLLYAFGAEYECYDITGPDRYEDLYDMLSTGDSTSPAASRMNIVYVPEEDGTWIGESLKSEFCELTAKSEFVDSWYIYSDRDDENDCRNIDLDKYAIYNKLTVHYGDIEDLMRFENRKIKNRARLDDDVLSNTVTLDSYDKKYIKAKEISLIYVNSEDKLVKVEKALSNSMFEFDSLSDQIADVFVMICVGCVHDIPNPINMAYVHAAASTTPQHVKVMGQMQKYYLMMGAAH